MYNRAHYPLIRPDILDAMDAWGAAHQQSGSFLMSVFANDLMEAVSRANQDNIAALTDICQYVYNELPSGCHGSREAVAAWIEAGKTEGAT